MKLKRKNLSISWMRWASVIAFMFCVYISLTELSSKYPFWILAFVYMIGIVFVRNNIIYSSPGIMTINVIMFIRYAILPIVMQSEKYISGFANNYNYVGLSILVMVIEEISLFCAINWTGKREKRKYRNSEKYIEDTSIYSNKIAVVIAMVVIVLLVVLLIKDRSLIGGFSLITQGVVEHPIVDASRSGLISILWQACTAWLYVFVIIRIKEKNQRTGKNNIFFALLSSAIFLLITFIGQASISRWYTIISFVAVYFTLIKMYPNKRRKISLIILVPVFVLLLVVTVYKNSDYLAGNSTIAESIKDVFSSKILNAYFAGPVNVNNAIGLIHDKHINISCLPKDVLNNMPIVNHWIDKSTNSVTMYNMYIGRYWNGGGDQIIPLVGQSAIYFTLIFSPVLSICSVFLLRRFDRLFIRAFSFSIYVYAFLAAWFGVATVLNITILSSWIYIRIIPFYCLIKFTEFIGKQKRNIKYSYSSEK